MVTIIELNNTSKSTFLTYTPSNTHTTYTHTNTILLFHRSKMRFEFSKLSHLYKNKFQKAYAHIINLDSQPYNKYLNTQIQTHTFDEYYVIILRF